MLEWSIQVQGECDNVIERSAVPSNSRGSAYYALVSGAVAILEMQ